MNTGLTGLASPRCVVGRRIGRSMHKSTPTRTAFSASMRSDALGGPSSRLRGQGVPSPARSHRDDLHELVTRGSWSTRVSGREGLPSDLPAGDCPAAPYGPPP